MALRLWRSAGARRIELEVLADNMRARDFYEHRGWREDGRERLGAFPPFTRVVGYSLDLAAVAAVDNR